MYQITMDIELSNVLISIGAFLLITLGGVLAWVIRKFTDSMQDIKKTVISIERIVDVINERILGIRKDVDKSDADLSDRIACLEEDVYRLEDTVATLKQDLAVLKVLEKEHHATK